MPSVATVGDAIQRLFGVIAVAAAEKTKVIQRQRVFDAQSLLKTFVLGFLHNPEPSDEELAQTAALCGAPVTASAIDQRFTPKLCAFLQEVFQQGAQQVVRSNKAMAPILERFPKVQLLDGSTIRLPDGQAAAFPGCGGSYDSCQAALKLQTTLDLRGGAVLIVIEPGKQPDAATERQHERLGPGSLRIADLGYFNLEVLQAIARAGEYFLSRLQFTTQVWLPDATAAADPKALMAWLSQQPNAFIDRPVQLGQQHRLAARLIAWRLPKEQADRRRQSLREDFKRKGKVPTAERLAWCDWTILVTNAAPELIAINEAVVLYRARWQIELLFKRWKSLNLVAAFTGASEVRDMVRLWARLLMSLVQHWLLLDTTWGDPRKSLTKVCQTIGKFAWELARSLSAGAAAIQQVIADLRQTLTKTCQRNKRSNPGTFELLNDASLLTFR